MGATVARGSVVEVRQQKVGYIEVHRLWCHEAYRDFCPGHALVTVLCKSGSVGMRDTDGHVKCSVCHRFLQPQFRYKLVAAVPKDVPRLPNPNAGKSGTEIQLLISRGESPHG